MRNEEGKTARPSLLYISFCCFLRLLPPLPFPNDVLAEWPDKDDNAMGGILCDDTMSEQSKI